MHITYHVAVTCWPPVASSCLSWRVIQSGIRQSHSVTDCGAFAPSVGAFAPISAAVATINRNSPTSCPFGVRQVALESCHRWLS